MWFILKSENLKLAIKEAIESMTENLAKQLLLMYAIMAFKVNITTLLRGHINLE